MDVNNQVLQSHNFPSESFGLSASEVGVCLLYYHDSLYFIWSNFGVKFFYNKNQVPIKDGIQGVTPIGGFDNHEFPSNVSDSSYISLLICAPRLIEFFFYLMWVFCLIFQGDIQPNGINRKSTNPFDFPFDSDVEQNNMVCPL